VSRAELRRFLTDVALDPALRRLAETEPDAAFAGYALDEADRAVLGRRDGEVMSLLAKALAPESDVPGDPGRAADATPRTGEPAPGPDAAAAPPAPPAVIALPDAAFAVRVRPQLIPGPGGAWQVTCAVSVEPVAGESGAGGAPPASAAVTAASPKSAAPPSSPSSPWGHRVDSPEARDAARAVLAASPAERRARLVDLVAALRGPGA
jgi:hypothetical protein